MKSYSPSSGSEKCERETYYCFALITVIYLKDYIYLKQVARVVSFDRDADNSYISAASLATEHRNMDLTLKFRTLDMGGLIFYVANADQVC